MHAENQVMRWTIADLSYLWIRKVIPIYRPYRADTYLTHLPLKAYILGSGRKYFITDARRIKEL